MGATKVFSSNGFQDAFMEETVKEVALILEERGYNAINQIVGYLVSGDPGYISSHKEARNKLTKFDRTQIIETLVKHYVGK